MLGEDLMEGAWFWKDPVDGYQWFYGYHAWLFALYPGMRLHGYQWFSSFYGHQRLCIW